MRSTKNVPPVKKVSLRIGNFQSDQAKQKTEYNLNEKIFKNSDKSKQLELIATDRQFASRKKIICSFSANPGWPP